MSQRNVTKLEKPAVKRTLRRFWEVTRMKPGAAFLAVFTSIAYVALLIFVNTWVMGLIVDRVQVLMCNKNWSEGAAVENLDQRSSRRPSHGIQRGAEKERPRDIHQARP